jgi:plastocyanin
MHHTFLSFCLAVGLYGIEQQSFSAEVPVNADVLAPQILAINRGDLVRWTKSQGPPDRLVESYTGEFKLTLSANSGWSATYRFDTLGTNYYQCGIRSGIVIVRDWTNSPPDITLNAPQEGDIFNCCGGEREPIPLLATPGLENKSVERVEFLSNGVIVATVTKAPYLVPRGDLPLGHHRLVARAVEQSGIIHESTAVNIVVQPIPAIVMSIRHLTVKNEDLIMVSWITPVTWHVMGRDTTVTTVGAAETSSTSFGGVRFWIERRATNAFFMIRRRF